MNSPYSYKHILLWAIPGLLMMLILACNSLPTKDLSASANRVDFNFDVRPILSDKCFACHGPDANQRKAGLRLDTPEGAFAALKEEPGKFAIVKGDAAHSAVIQRVRSEDPNEVMPPPESNLTLTQEEIETLTKWIKQGAEYQKHWAFLPPVKEKVKLEEVSWAHNEIDYFIYQKMKTKGLSPNKEGDKARLLKRLAFDLTGLPPSLEMQEEFLSDDGQDAYEKVVDKLMADKHYGEKMAIHWLDLARYADSHGYQDDGYRTMWPWRDWVIHAFNENYTFDKFLTWQLAGDLLPDPDKEMLLATGFNRNHKITQEGGVIQEEYRIEYVTDRTNTFGKAFLGLTLECSKCHDHKYDPISQEAYYSTFAFFNQVPEKGLYADIGLNSPGDPPNMMISQEEVDEVLDFINLNDTAGVTVMIMDDSTDVRPTYILERGIYDAHGEEVSFGTPEDVMKFDTSVYMPNRLGLSEWLLAEKHPLTSRVFVNRIWQEFFGRGLVKTTEDFGMQGELPSHKELLDWLAVDFRENGWDIKRLVKQMVMSATYRQSSVISDSKRKKDPENIYLSHAPRLRLSAELVRDHVLASSGLLNKEIGGPSVKPYQPDGIWESTTSGRGLLAKYVQDHGKDLYRRGMYVFIKRTAPPPAMLMFDASNRDQCEVRRMRTNTPLQALVMLNDPYILEASRVLGENLLMSGEGVDELLTKAFRLIICREMEAEEKELISSYYQQEYSYFSEHQEEASAFIKVGEFPSQEIEDVPALAALMQVIHTMYNMEESIMKT